MTASRHPAPQLSFGPFEFDSQTGELREHGVSIKLHGQPIEILGLLIERRGKLVTREELRETLWPGQTIGDFEQGLNAAIQRLREALGDSADKPRYIETLHRRGYRFIAPVDGIEGTISRFRLLPGSVLVGAAVLALVGVTLALMDSGRFDGWLADSASREITSIAVLPLENLSGDPDQDYFADGMTEALITELSKIRALKVISRMSTIQYKQVKKPLPQIAQELGVNGVIEGSVMREGDQVRVTVQLLHGPTDQHLWGEEFQRELRSVLALQSEVAQAIVEEIQVALTPAEESRLASTRPVNPDAYVAVLRGNYFQYQRTEEGLSNGLRYYQQAIEIDPNYAPAYLGVADTYLVMAGWAFIPPTEAHQKARAAVMKALEIDETLSHAHSDLAGIRFEYEWDWSAAEQEFQRALELNPNRAGIHRYHAEFLSFMGDHAQAIAEAKRAYELSPLHLITHTMVGITLHNARQYDQAIEQCQEVLELDPNFVPALYYLGRAYEQKGRYEEAITQLAEARRISGGSSRMAAGLAHAYALSGRQEDAQQILDELTRHPNQDYVSPYEVGVVFVGLGDEEQALTWLDRAVKERDTYALHLKVDPNLDPIRSDPRFQSLLRSMNFPE